jgi:hypothetical protein
MERESSVQAAAVVVAGETLVVRHYSQPRHTEAMETQVRICSPATTTVAVAVALEVLAAGPLAATEKLLRLATEATLCARAVTAW